MKADGASHKKVVMSANDCAVCAVLLSFIGQILVENLLVSFCVKMIADALNERRYNHRLCGRIGMKAIFARKALPYLIFGLAARVEVWVNVGDLIEDILRLVASFNLTFAVVCLQSVALYDEKGIVIVCGNLGGTPSEAVNVAVARHCATMA